MATFTNYATLSYSGGTTNSNTVTGEILETLAVTQTAVMDHYSAKDNVTFVTTIVNSSTSAVSGLTVTDDLGGYGTERATVYPLEYVDGSMHYYVNGVLQAAPIVSVGPPLAVSNISIPAEGNAILIYEVSVTNYAPLASGDTIIDTVTVTSSELSSPITASETITASDSADLTISKSMYPPVVSENGQLTYTFVISNTGNVEAAATDALILTDIFDPVLTLTSVTFNGAPMVVNTDYTYNAVTGEFATTSGQLTVPAASYTQNADGTWTLTPGTSVLVVTGTV